MYVKPCKHKRSIQQYNNKVIFYTLIIKTNFLHIYLSFKERSESSDFSQNHAEIKYLI